MFSDIYCTPKHSKNNRKYKVLQQIENKKTKQNEIENNFFQLGYTAIPFKKEERVLNVIQNTEITCLNKTCCHLL